MFPGYTLVRRNARRRPALTACQAKFFHKSHGRKLPALTGRGMPSSFLKRFFLTKAFNVHIVDTFPVPIVNLNLSLSASIAVSLLMLILMLAGISGKFTWTLHAIQVAAQSIAVS